MQSHDSTPYSIIPPFCSICAENGADTKMQMRVRWCALMAPPSHPYAFRLLVTILP